VSAIRFAAWASASVTGRHCLAKRVSPSSGGVRQGVTFFDTAEAYGPYANEELVGEALAPVRDQVVIATKFGFKFGDGKIGGLDSSPAHIREVAEASLEAAEDRSDRPLLSAPRRSGGPDRGRRRGVKDLIREGKSGTSHVRGRGAERIRRAHAVQPVAAVQSEYSLWFRDPEAEIIPRWRSLASGSCPSSPLGKGFLTGKIDDSTTFDSTELPQHRSAVHGGEPQGEPRVTWSG